MRELIQISKIDYSNIYNNNHLFATVLVAQVIYSYNPTVNLTSTAQKNNVVGGEVALWGEYVDDHNIIR